MYRLYTCSRDYTSEPTSFAPQLLLEEIGASYELVEIDLDNIPPWYLDYHPRGKIPVLEVLPTATMQGALVIYPSAAILMYLGEQHSQVGLLPMQDNRMPVEAYQWLIYLSEELQSWYMMDSFPERYCLESSQTPMIETRAAQLIDEAWTELDAVLAKRPFLLGQDYSIVDMYWYMIARWSRPECHKPIDAYPNLAHSVELIEARQVTRNLLATSDMPPLIDCVDL